MCLLLGLSIQIAADEKSREAITGMMRYSLMLGLVGLTGISIPLISKLDRFSTKWTAFVGILFALLITQIIAKKTHYIATITYSVLLLLFQVLTFIYKPKDLSHSAWHDLANEIVFSFIVFTLLSSLQQDNRIVPALTLATAILKSAAEFFFVFVKYFTQQENVQPKQVVAQKFRLLFLSLPSLLCLLIGLRKLAEHLTQRKSPQIVIGIGCLLNVMDVAVRLYIENAMQSTTEGATATTQPIINCQSFLHSAARKVSTLWHGTSEERAALNVHTSSSSYP